MSLLVTFRRWGVVPTLIYFSFKLDYYMPCGLTLSPLAKILILSDILYLILVYVHYILYLILVYVHYILYLILVYVHYILYLILVYVHYILYLILVYVHYILYLILVYVHYILYLMCMYIMSPLSPFPQINSGKTVRIPLEPEALHWSPLVVNSYCNDNTTGEPNNILIIY